MSDEHSTTQPMPSDSGNGELSASAKRWMQELGVETESFGYMLRKPTDQRPFVYEVRFDLLPAKASESLSVLKGFGADGGLCAFVNGGTFVQMVRNANSLMRSGKLVWYEDAYAPKNYEQRAKRFADGTFFLK